MNTVRMPGFTAEVVLDPAIRNKHYGGLFAGTSEPSGVLPQLMMSDIMDFLESLLGGGGGAAAGAVAGGAIGGPVGGVVGGAIGGAVGAEVGRQVHCIRRSGRFCD